MTPGFHGQRRDLDFVPNAAAFQERKARSREAARRSVPRSDRLANGRLDDTKRPVQISLGNRQGR